MEFKNFKKIAGDTAKAFSTAGKAFVKSASSDLKKIKNSEDFEKVYTGISNHLSNLKDESSKTATNVTNFATENITKISSEIQDAEKRTKLVKEIKETAKSIANDVVKTYRDVETEIKKAVQDTKKNVTKKSAPKAKAPAKPKNTK